MQNIIDSIRSSLGSENWYVALFASLALPDILGKIENPTLGSAARYVAWFEANLHQYEKFLSGDDCYALRCATLHEGRDNISEQRIRKVLDHYIFSTSSSHRNLFQDITINNGPSESFLQLNVKSFCEEMCDAASAWLTSAKDDVEKQAKLGEAIVIREPGYSYKGVIKFA